MKEVTKEEYLAHFIRKDACISVPECGIAEWRLRGQTKVIARSIETEDDIKYFIEN